MSSLEIPTFEATRPNYSLMTKPKVQNYLHELIKNLSQTEKRYFKLLAKQQTPSKKNDYIRLFEEIDKQEVFNEKPLKKNLKELQ